MKLVICLIKESYFNDSLRKLYDEKKRVKKKTNCCQDIF